MKKIEIKQIPASTINNFFFIWAIPIAAIIARGLWAALSNIDPTDGADWERYDHQSTNILLGYYNLAVPLFITSPLYSYFIAAMKYIFGEQNYIISAVFIQVVVAGLSARALIEASNILFRDVRVSLIAGLMYSLHPFSIYYTNLLGQESIFQSLLIFTFFYYVKYTDKKDDMDLVAFSFLFVLAFLTKSHIALGIPIIVLHFFILNHRNVTKFLKNTTVFLAILFAATFPNAYSNLQMNNTYALSSTGWGHFLTGHNDDIYKMAFDPPLPGSEEWSRLKSMQFHALRDAWMVVREDTHDAQQAYYREIAFEWIAENPSKTFKLIVHNLKEFISPGFNRLFYTSDQYYASMALQAPLFILAYFGIAYWVVTQPRKHLGVTFLLFVMVLFSLCFYHQGRFRTITIEWCYIIYASFVLVLAYDKIAGRMSLSKDVIFDDTKNGSKRIS